MREFAFGARWTLYRDGTLDTIKRDPAKTVPLDPATADVEAVAAR